MKRSSRIKPIVAGSLIAVMAAWQPYVRGVFVPDTGLEPPVSVSHGFIVQDFTDGPSAACWVLNRGVAIYTAAFIATGNWSANQLDGTFHLHPDGSLDVYWEQTFNGVDFDFAIWTLNAQGAVVKAVTFRTSGWNPFLDGDGSVVGSRTLLQFDGLGGNAGQTAAWLLGAAGNIERTFQWQNSPPGGWAFSDVAPEAFGALLRMVYHKGDSPRKLAFYLFTQDGDWIDAKTFDY